MFILSKKIKLSLVAISILNIQSAWAISFKPLDSNLKENEKKRVEHLRTVYGIKQEELIFKSKK